MIKKLFTSQTKTITGAAIILASMTLISRLIAILRDRFFAHYFGAGDILDAYYSAFRIPDFIYNLIIAGAVSAGFIPIFIKLKQKNKKTAWNLVNNLLNSLGIGLFFLTIILYFLTPYIIPFLVPGFKAEKLKITTDLTKIMFLSPFILGLSSLVGGILNAYRNFFIFSLSPILYNLGIIIGIIYLTPHFGYKGLAYGVILGALMHLSIQLPSLWQYGYKYKPIINLKDKYLKQIFKLTIPRTLTIGANQINLLITTSIASTLGSGNIAVFNLANNLQRVAVGIIGVSFSMAVFPSLSKFTANNEQKKFNSTLISALKQILFLIIPATVIFLLLRAQIVRIILGTGKFNWTATKTTANILAFFALSLFAQALIFLLIKAFHALYDTWTPFLSTIFFLFLNIIGILIFKDKFGISGLALAFSLANIIELVILFKFLNNKIKIETKKIFIHIIKLTIAGFFMAITIQILKTPISILVNMQKFWGISLQLIISSVSGLAVYLFVCYLLKVEELIILIQSLKKKWLKLTNLSPEIEKFS